MSNPALEDLEEQQSGGPGCTPWEADEVVDYDRLVKYFGTTPIDDELLDRMESLSNIPLHPWLKRGLFYSHRDLNMILDAVEAGEDFYLYTGRGPSAGALHMGHLMPFFFTKYLQEAFDVPLVVQLTDDEKYLWKDLDLNDCHTMGIENAKDIIACGLDPEKTFIFSNLDYVGSMYPNIVRIQKHVTGNQARGIFGFTLTDNIGKWSFPAVQAAPSFSSSFPEVFGRDSNLRCLIPCAIDQDPYFRMTRDVAPRLGFHKPAVIHSKFFPALQGPRGKMSSSIPNSAIFLSDTYKQIRRKAMKHAFSGGKQTAEEHRRLGGDPDMDVSYQYLRVFEYDDEKLQETYNAFKSGEMLSGEIKQVMVDCVWEYVKEFQAVRSRVTDDDVRAFMEPRRLI